MYKLRRFSFFLLLTALLCLLAVVPANAGYVTGISSNKVDFSTPEQHNLESMKKAEQNFLQRLGEFSQSHIIY